MLLENVLFLVSGAVVIHRVAQNKPALLVTHHSNHGSLVLETRPMFISSYAWRKVQKHRSFQSPGWSPYMSGSLHSAWCITSCTGGPESKFMHVTRPSWSGLVSSLMMSDMKLLPFVSVSCRLYASSCSACQKRAFMGSKTDCPRAS